MPALKWSRGHVIRYAQSGLNWALDCEGTSVSVLEMS